MSALLFTTLNSNKINGKAPKTSDNGPTLEMSCSDKKINRMTADPQSHTLGHAPQLCKLWQLKTRARTR